MAAKHRPTALVFSLGVLASPALASAQTPATPPTAAAPAAPAAPPEALAPDPDAATWRARDDELFEQDAITGGVGLLHTQHAESGAPGQFRLGFVSEFFSAGFLCTASNPCPNPRGSTPITSDTMTHLGGTLTLSATLTSWLEAYAATGAYGNSDSANIPSLLQVFGDTQLGVKFYHPIGKVFHLAGIGELDLVNGSGAVGLVGDGTGGKLKVLGTFDLRGADKPSPVRISINAGYAIDDSAAVVSDYEAATGGPVTRIERFGLQFNRVDHVDLAVGAEAFFSQGRVRPFLEYTLLAPINRQGYACPELNASNDGCLANDTVVPSKLTLGGRFYPWKHGFSLLAAFDVGVTGVGNFIEEVMPTAPWTLYVGAGWAIDTWDRPVVTHTRTVERLVGPRPQGQLRGFVHVKDKADPVAGAVVAFDDHPDVTARVSGADGRLAVPVDPGTYKLTVHAKGYRDGTCGGEMGPTPVDVPVDCPLEPALVEVTANEITIENQIQFQVDSAVILPESDALMHEIADTLIKNPRITRVEVQGHTDSSGSADYNQKLSEARAISVRDWLVAHGVAQERLVAHGYGEERPLIPNVTKGMKALNRRVQFIILEQTGQKAP